MPSKFEDRIAALAEDAEAARASFETPADPPDEQLATQYLREGVGEAIAVYVDARSEEWDRFGREEFDDLERAMNVYLELYAACYGVDGNFEFTVREAAEAFVDTHNVADVAWILTGVPGAEGAEGAEDGTEE